MRPFWFEGTLTHLFTPSEVHLGRTSPAERARANKPRDEKVCYHHISQMHYVPLSMTDVLCHEFTL